MSIYFIPKVLIETGALSIFDGNALSRHLKAYLWNILLSVIFCLLFLMPFPSIKKFGPSNSIPITDLSLRKSPRHDLASIIDEWFPS